MKTYLCKSILAVSVVLMLASCQSNVRTDIATFRNTSIPFAKGDIRVVPVDIKGTENLEFRYYKIRVEDKLRALGFTPTESATSEYIAQLAYGVSRQEADKLGSRVFVSGNIGRFSRYSHYGSVIFADDLGKEFEFVREIDLIVAKRSKDTRVADEKADKGEQLIQVRALSEGKCEYLTVVFDEMLEAIFSDFLRPNGSVEKVSVKGDIRCP
ncbi:MAG: hypothetical protein ACI9Y1_001271 [Lentisphaeria bacterium]|jgi:hypothetical protein